MREDDDGVVRIFATYETNDEEIQAETYDDVNNEEGQVEWYEDLKTGEGLDPRMVKEAREEELKFMKKIGLFELVPVEDCWKSTGKDPITTKWVDVNKGSTERPDVRCRLVARDFKPKGEAIRADLFAAMPPLEAKKLLFQKAAVENARNRARGKPGIKVMLVDVKKAHLNGFLEEDEEAFVWLPAEANAGRTSIPMAVRHEASSERMGARVLRHAGRARFREGPRCANGVLLQREGHSLRGTWRRLHVHRPQGGLVERREVHEGGLRTEGSSHPRRRAGG
jgi:hypothetical protein